MDRAARRAGRGAAARFGARAGSRSACSRRSRCGRGWRRRGRRAPSAASIELGRVATYLGVLVLAIALQGRDGGAPHDQRPGLRDRARDARWRCCRACTRSGFRPTTTFAFLGAGSARKLSYPLNYWNALAAFAAMGVPLLLGVALGARTLAGQALAAAMLPLSALCIYLTISRGGALALVVGIVVFLLFVPRAPATRWERCSSPASGRRSCCRRRRSATRCRTACRPRPRSTRAPSSSWLAVIVCGGVALLQVAMGLAARHLERPALLGAEPAARRCSRRSRRRGRLRRSASPPARPAARERSLAGVQGAGRHRRGRQPGQRLQPAAGRQRQRPLPVSGRRRVDANATDPLEGHRARARSSSGGRATRTHARLRPRRALALLRDARGDRHRRLGAARRRCWCSCWARPSCDRCAPAGHADLDRGRRRRPRGVHDRRGLRVGLGDGGDRVRRHGARGRDRRRARGAAVASAPTAPRARSRRASRIALLAVAAIGAVAVPMAGALATRDSRAAAADGRLAAALADSRTARAPAALRGDAAPAARARARAGRRARERGRRRAGRHRRRADELAHLVRARAHRGAARRGRAPRSRRCARRGA